MAEPQGRFPMADAHLITGTYSNTGGHKDVFILTGHKAHLALFSDSDSRVFITGGTNDSVALDASDSHERIYDGGHGTVLSFTGMPEPVSVYGFQFDHAGTIHIANGPQTVTGLIQPDGHGGTMVGNIDLVNDTNVSPSQIVLSHS
jgi:hypothetical protein